MLILPELKGSCYCYKFELSTAGFDFTPFTSNIIFGPHDREACTSVNIINDDVSNEIPEEFQVSFLVMQQDQEGMEVVNLISTVTIIDDDVGKRANCNQLLHLNHTTVPSYIL